MTATQIPSRLAQPWAQLESELMTRERALASEWQALAEQAGASGEQRTELAHALLANDPEGVRHHPDDRELALGRADALHAEQVAIGEALLALRDGRYGACADCGESIPVERLLAQPTALRCVRCQALTEQTSGAA